jgi:hypothetical protein
MLSGLSKKQKNILTITSLVFLFLFVFIVITVVNNLNKNQFGNGIKIQNFDSKVKNLPKVQRDSIESELYYIVKNNIAEGVEIKVKDAVIRENSESQGFNPKNKTYTGYFIVDMPSIKQSYQVNYFYPTNPSLAPPPGYVMTITCPLKQQLVYGSFNCQDEKTSQTANEDSLLKYLPKSSLNYEITAEVENNKIVKLFIRLLLSESDYNTGVNEAINTYKSEALSFIKATGVDPNNYNIEFTY